MITFHVMTLFPEMITGGINHSIIKRAIEDGIVNVNCINIRDFSKSKHKHVDDYSYGGGVGMVIMPQPVYDTYLHLKSIVSCENVPVIYMSPHGKTFNQQKAKELSLQKELIILCGHYEGIDQRVVDEIVTDEISIGDYILTGGELAAMVVIDAVSRLVSGVLGKDASSEIESFSNNLLEYPQYTRPYEFLGKKVPDVLISGHHANIEKWRHEQSLALTKAKRPDLLK